MIIFKSERMREWPNDELNHFSNYIIASLPASPKIPLLSLKKKNWYDLGVGQNLTKFTNKAMP
jgi:hypothetical protein